MAGKISIYTLGHSGVILDWNPLEPSLAEDSLHAAQNATVEMTDGHGGALRKRAGLKRFNSAYAGGVILGGTPMAVAGTGGAPSSGGGGHTGGGTGTGDGTGAPGGTFDGGSVVVAPAGAAKFNAGSPLFSGKRLIVMGLTNNTHGSTGGQGWFVTSKGLADVATKVTTGPPEAVYLYPPTVIFDKANGSHPFAIDYETNQLYYVASHHQVNGTDFTDTTIVDASLSIYRTGGASFDLVCVLPHTPSLPGLPTLEVTPWGVNYNASTAPTGRPTRAAITAMCLDRTTGAEDKVLYIAQKCRAYAQNNTNETGNWGRILMYNVTTGALSVLNTDAGPTSDTSRTTIAGIPYALAYFQRSLYWGNFNLNASSELVKDTTAGSAIYATTQDKSYSVTDRVGGTEGDGVTCMLAFPRNAPASDPTMDPRSNEILFAGLAVHKATPTLSYIIARQRGAVATPALWASTKEGGTGDPASDGNYFVSMVEFNDCLYASFYNPGTSAYIYKFTPSYGAAHLAADGYWNGDGVWSTVLTDVTTFHAYGLYVDQDTIYAIALGSQGLAGNNRREYISTNGTAWTDKTSNIGTFGGDGSTPLPILFGLDQA